jgi:hypothetical protein
MLPKIRHHVRQFLKESSILLSTPNQYFKENYRSCCSNLRVTNTVCIFTDTATTYNLRVTLDHHILSVDSTDHMFNV